MFYVYEFYLTENNEVFYAGKGCGKRYKSISGRNKLFNKVISNNNYNSRIVKEFENEDDAFCYERSYIRQMKEKGFCYCNIRLGGDGGSRKYHVSPKVNNKKKAVIINNIKYESIKEASIAFNVDVKTIKEWCKKGINNKLQTCHYDNQESVENRKTQYYRLCRPLIYKGIIYESAKDLANELNCSKSRIVTWARKGFDVNGEICKYLDDNRNLTFKSERAKRNCSIFINGIKYKSCKIASEQLNISIRIIYNCLNGSKTDPNFICKYVDDNN